MLFEGESFFCFTHSSSQSSCCMYHRYDTRIYEKPIRASAYPCLNQFDCILLLTLDYVVAFSIPGPGGWWCFFGGQSGPQLVVLILFVVLLVL